MRKKKRKAQYIGRQQLCDTIHFFKKLRMKEKKQLLENIINGIKEKKGKDIITIDLQGIEGVVCDYFVVCEGNSPSQVAALAESVEHVVKTNMQESPIRVQGHQLAEWIAIDYGDIMVHIFVPELRSFYNIDNLWSDAKTEKIPNEE